MSIESRLDRIERQLGVEVERESIEIPLGNGHVWRMTERQMGGLVRWLQERNQGLGGVRHEQSAQAS